MKVSLKDVRISHRGLWNEENPENSIGAFKRSIEARVPIELDVHILKDGNLVVIHDDSAKRMTGVDVRFKDMTLDEVKKLKLNGTEYGIPTLEEVLDLVHGQVLLDIEIKTDVKSFKICKKIAERLDQYDGEFMIKSFNPMYVVWFRFFRPKFTRGLLVSKLKSIKMNGFIKWFCYHMCLNFLASPDFIALDAKNLPNKKIDKLYKKGVPILLWTIHGSDEKITYDGIIYEEK